LISVVIVNWNQRDFLRACLGALARQTGTEFETIVVDNGSHDGSPEMAETEFRARVIRNTGNRGFCAANNQGIAAARGEFVALLNNDTEVEPGWLAALVRACTRSPDVGMAASKVLVWEDPRRIDKVGHLIYPDGQNKGRGSGALDTGQYDREEEVLWPDGCAALYRKTMLDRIGGFDEDFFAYGDDAELGLRARIAGWKCRYTPEAVVRHHRGSTLGKDSAWRLELIERNRLLLAFKLFPWSLLWLNPFYFAARVLAGYRAAQRGAGDTAYFPGARGKWRMAVAFVKGDLGALRLAPRMFRKRREIARLRRLSPGEVRRLILAHRLSLKETTSAPACCAAASAPPFCSGRPTGCTAPRKRNSPWCAAGSAGWRGWTRNRCPRNCANTTPKRIGSRRIAARWGVWKSGIAGWFCAATCASRSAPCAVPARAGRCWTWVAAGASFWG
jgi:GT2 family glycosyltransferase